MSRTQPLIDLMAYDAEPPAGGSDFEPIDFVPSSERATLIEGLADAHGSLPSTSTAEPDAIDPADIPLIARGRQSAGLTLQTIALLASVAIHLGATAAFMNRTPDIQIAGGGPISVSMIGSAFEDAELMGEVTPEPVETAPVEPVETAEQAITPQQTPVETPESEAETLRATPVEEIAPSADGIVVAEEPAPTEPEPFEMVEQETVPVEPEPLEAESAPEEAPIASAETIEPLPDPIANAPIPTPRPAYTPPPPPRQVAEPARPAPQAQGNQGQQQAQQRQGTSDGQARSGAATQGSQASAQAQAAGNAAVSNYPGQVVTRLRRALRYPAAARRDRLTGEVHVSFTIAAGGGVSGISVVRSSGSPVLDQAAIETVQRAAPFPQIPQAAGRSSWPFSVPLAFTR
ncbi:energy transducer TonB family protein [Georhizobium profundi]|nr:energy transducer TonB [Georhizobium profundi]